MDGRRSSGGHVALCSNDSPAFGSSRVESIQYEVYVKRCVDDTHRPMNGEHRPNWNAMAVYQSWPSEIGWNPHGMFETMDNMD
eukprot:scaffold8893_cov48-Attheya_sp.AAC.3